MDTKTPDTSQFPDSFYEQVCFACGIHNDAGLGMKFSRLDDGSVQSLYKPRVEDQGFPSIVHGGVLASLIDEAMAWALWSQIGVLGVTAKLEIKYRSRVTTDDALLISATVSKRTGRRINVHAEIRSAKKELLVESDALYLKLPGNQQEHLARQLGWRPMN
ncbi:MAG: PaaI family thioesterase [Dehalococcoidia bacterium]|nr:PaaI family thioesterase [Dehalococcoidia bacterium]